MNNTEQLLSILTMTISTLEYYANLNLLDDSETIHAKNTLDIIRKILEENENLKIFEQNSESYVNMLVDEIRNKLNNR